MIIDEAKLAKEEADKKINWGKLDTPIEHNGRAITLPAEPGRMSIDAAIEALQRKQKDENTEVRVHEIIDAYPLDAAVAFVKAMAKLYGWSSPVPTPSFFGPQPPQIISVKTGFRDEDVIQCPLGSFKLPGVEKFIGTAFTGAPRGNGSVFVIHATVRRKEQHILLELANETRRIVKEQSIYRGKAIRLGVDDEGQLDLDNPPEFMDVSDAGEGILVFNDSITGQIETNILTPMKFTARCREMKIPLKRGILLEGPYGTGKSLTARMAAKVAEDNGWTFILLDKVQGLRAALEFANRYSPAVVFAEDIDRIATDRDEAANDLINTIDGVISKRSEIMTILTTNFAEKLNPVILRPGRLDAVISLRAPDIRTVERLIRFYAGDLLAPTADISPACVELEGQIPASIRECVERAKLGMVGRADNKLSNRDILIAAQTMKNHLSLLNKEQTEKTEPEKLAESLRAVVSGSTIKLMEGNGLDKELAERVEQLHNRVC